MSEYILEVKELTKVFGGLVALNNLGLAIKTGRITAIIGPNGAGKTTLFNIVTGVYATTRGEVMFDGRSLNKITPYHRIQMGIARTFQHVLLFQNMTVLSRILPPEAQVSL